MRIGGSALAGFLAMGAMVAAARAGDLPSRRAAPADYVKVCDAFGLGFFFLPGLDTCIRTGGFARAEYAYVNAANTVLIPTMKASTTGVPAVAAGGYTPYGNLGQTGFHARVRVEFDARTQTGWGAVRTFLSLRATATSGIFLNADNYMTGALTGQSGTTSNALENALVQFAGFTFGRTTAETFSFLAPYQWVSLASASFPAGINLLAYTRTFGGGVSATVAIEDRTGMSAASNPTFIANSTFSTPVGVYQPATGGVTNGPLGLPALAGNVRLDRDWGALQVMGGVVQNAATTTFASASNATIHATGWAIGAGLKLNLPMLAAGDVLNVTGAVSTGALDWLSNWSTSGRIANSGREFGGLLRIDRDLYVYPGSASGACAAATTYVASCLESEETSGWSVAGHFTHYWTPTIRTLIGGSYYSLTPGRVTRDTDWQLGGLSKADVWEIIGQAVWSPISNMNVGVEVAYERLEQNLTGSNGAKPSASPAAFGPFSPSATEAQARFRVERLF